MGCQWLRKSRSRVGRLEGKRGQTPFSLQYTHLYSVGTDTLIATLRAWDSAVSSTYWALATHGSHSIFKPSLRTSLPWLVRRVS